MALFLVEHHHTPETCPTKNPEMVRQLAGHVTAANAAACGVKILADWVNEPEHTVILVLEAESAESAAKFALPFLHVGSITIRAGETCEETARRCLGA